MNECGPRTSRASSSPRALAEECQSLWSTGNDRSQQRVTGLRGDCPSANKAGGDPGKVSVGLDLLFHVLSPTSPLILLKWWFGPSSCPPRNGEPSLASYTRVFSVDPGPDPKLSSAQHDWRCVLQFLTPSQGLGYLLEKV